MYCWTSIYLGKFNKAWLPSKWSNWQACLSHIAVHRDTDRNGKNVELHKINAYLFLRPNSLHLLSSFFLMFLKWINIFLALCWHTVKRSPPWRDIFNEVKVARNITKHETTASGWSRNVDSMWDWKLQRGELPSSTILVVWLPAVQITLF